MRARRASLEVQVERTHTLAQPHDIPRVFLVLHTLILTRAAIRGAGAPPRTPRALLGAEV
jgi:hypothetical protein